MKVNIRKIPILILCAIMLFSVCAIFAGCNDNSEIEELRQRIEELEEENKKLSDRVEELENQIVQGTFYSLQEAYDNGFLTKENLMSIAFYHNGGRLHNEEIMNEEYKPTSKTPEVLSELTELEIKRTAAKDYRDKVNIKEAKAEGFTITEYSGTYGDCIAVMMRNDYSGTTGAAWTDSVAGVNFYYISGIEIQIWRKETK